VSTIKSIVHSVEILSVDQYKIGDYRFEVNEESNLSKTPSSNDGVAIQEDSNQLKNLINSLTQHIYQGYYTQGQCNFKYNLSFQKPPDRRESVRFMEDLSTSIQADKKMDLFWKIVHVYPNLSLQIEKNTERRQVNSGSYFLPEGTHQLVPGAFVHLHHHKDDREIQSIFYYIYGDSKISNERDLIRFYFNLSAESVFLFVSIITECFNKYHLPFTLKCLNHPSLYETRVDTAILFINKKDHHYTWSLLKILLPKIKPHLKLKIPLFLYKILDGVGFAEDIGSEESFGASRSKLLATYIVQLYQNGRTHSKEELKLFCQSFNITPDHLYMAQSSDFHYPFVVA
jgi:hypothetical protein